jgi:anaerobic selenocysteine-containing dehydrogenase
VSVPNKPSRSLIERTAVSLGLIPDTDRPATPATGSGRYERPSSAPLQRYPLPEAWDDFVEHDPKTHSGHGDGAPAHYRLIPTVCFNCESGCGLLAYVDKQTGEIRKFEGNPLHPGSRGKNCAKGPATINQVNDPDRILAPMKRAGARGEGKWKQVSWDEALEDIGRRVRNALAEKRHDEIVYHVGRPGSEGFMDRVLRAWGVDGHNSHTNICSGGARFGYALWSGFDRPSPDYANARFILALNAHLESGHYFNPHAQRITEGKMRGAKMAVVDPRLSNTASMADYWLPTKPGTEAALLLAMVHVILEEQMVDKAFIERWVNWREYLQATKPRSHGATEGQKYDSQMSQMDTDSDSGHLRESATSVDAPASSISVDAFLVALRREYVEFTPEFAAEECGVPAAEIREIARLIGQAGSRFCSHTWRGAASAHLGGWQVSRCLFFLHVLTGSVGTEGGCGPSAWHKYKANLVDPPPPTNGWNELHWPREYPLAHYEMSELLPHFLKDGRGKIDVYFTRVFNPVWTYPDGFTWIEALSDESKVGLHVALTPTWNETALFADYVLPMGHGPERHDLTTYETHAATWIAFRQPVRRAHKQAEGEHCADTRDANPGQVWEEDEFWIALSWAIDPDGSLGIRKYFESKQQPGEKLTVDEYYAHIFDRVPGLPEKAKQHGKTPLEYMRTRGAFEVGSKTYEKHERVLSEAELEGAKIDPETGLVTKNGTPIGICHETRSTAVATQSEPEAPARSNAVAHGLVEGFHTPSRLLEFYISGNSAQGAGNGDRIRAATVRERATLAERASWTRAYYRPSACPR